ncbi:hypothetical protein [Haloferula sp.]|uniref:hypothetical protein n=1 Tax=Haloferula sp. TaxID=2497595 RepID=UPI00329EDF89
MKKVLTILFALISGIYLLTVGIAPDPLPFIDEATALLIFVKSMSALGFDISRFLPFLGKKAPKTAEKESPVVDV